MKLCRFELASAPGTPRSGIAYDGRVYETQGTEPVAIHQFEDVRILAPVARASSLRILEPGESNFVYGNPGLLFGPGSSLNPDETTTAIPALAIIIGGHGGKVQIEDADDLVLGYANATIFKNSTSGGAAYDGGYAMGPVLTSPDDFDDEAVVNSKGKNLLSSSALTINNQEPTTLPLANMPGTPAEILSKISQTAPLVEGDVILVGLTSVQVSKGDEIKLSHSKMGALVTRLL